MSSSNDSTIIPKPARPRYRRILRRLLWSALILFVLILIDYFTYPQLAHVDGPPFNIGANGLWLRYTWYFGLKSDQDIARLSGRLDREQVKYVFPHVRFIGKEGALRYRYPESGRHLVEALHANSRDRKVIAWVYAGNSRGEGQVDLSRPEVRRRMVAEAIWLVRDCGFDGVQWDYEICPDGDPHFLALLNETRSKLPAGKILSAAVPLWLPGPLGRWGWSEDYFSKVAENCDQIAVMAYDSGFWLPRSYVWLMRQQVARVLPAVERANAACRVLIGVPTYGTGFLSHNPQAENIRLALKGVRDGMAETAAGHAVFSGVAVFADYTTQPEEWTIYEQLWLDKR